MNANQMLRRVAELEFKNDQLEAEIRHIDTLMRLIGFQEGLQTIKTAAQEMILLRQKESE